MVASFLNASPKPGLWEAVDYPYFVISRLAQSKFRGAGQLSDRAGLWPPRNSPLRKAKAIVFDAPVSWQPWYFAFLAACGIRQRPLGCGCLKTGTGGIMKHLGRIAVAISLVASQYALGWGERGHHTICEVATRLVQNHQLKAYLLGKGHQMGHVCNIPDIYWRDLGPQAKSGDAAHFLNPQKLGYTIESLPTDFDAIVANAGKPASKVADELGSLWWRADQFFREAVDGGQRAKRSKFPDAKHEQDKTLPFNRGIYDMLVSMGLMGHFVGDASQPFHNDEDYDGYAAGHGGIHAYYETASVNAMGLDLITEVEAAALDLRAKKDLDLDSGTVVERMKRLSISAAHDLKAVEAADEILSPSQDRPHQFVAKRPPSAQGAKAFQNLIVPELARSSLLLAKFWDEAFESSGSPDLFKYHSYRYPLAPDFADLDYVN